MDDLYWRVAGEGIDQISDCHVSGLFWLSLDLADKCQDKILKYMKNDYFCITTLNHIPSVLRVKYYLQILLWYTSWNLSAVSSKYNFLKHDSINFPEVQEPHILVHYIAIVRLSKTF